MIFNLNCDKNLPPPKLFANKVTALTTALATAGITVFVTRIRPKHYENS